MKKSLLRFALAALTIGLLGSCSEINERLDDLDKRVDTIENNTVSTIDQQIKGINASIADLETIRQDIKGLISAKESQGSDVTSLKEADKALETKIADLKKYVEDELKKYAKTDWVNATFATLTQYEALVKDIAKINDEIAQMKKDLGSLDTKLNQAVENVTKSISGLESSMKTWVNSQLSAYYTAAQIDAKIGDLQAQLKAMDGQSDENKTKIAELEADIDKLSGDLETAKATIKSEYEAAIAKAISENNGKISEQIQSKIDEVNKTVGELAGRVDALELAVAVLTGRVDAIEAMIQTVSVVPAYNDGSVEALDGILSVKCIVEPASAISSLEKDSLKVIVNEVRTKAGGFETIAVSKFIKDEENGTVTVKADISSYIPEADGKALTVAVKIASGISRYTTEFVPVTFSGSGLPKGTLYGEFSVSAEKKVHFSKGNMFYDGSAFQFEANQFDAATAWNASHIGHFFWSKNASIAVAESYSEEGSANDVFFTNADETSANPTFSIGSEAGKFRNLSKDEWIYLLDTRANAENLKKVGVTVCGKVNCLVIAPDSFSGSIADSYDNSEWDAAEEEGLVCLPAAGLRFGKEVGNSEVIGLYWTASAADYYAGLNIGFDGNNKPQLMADKGSDSQFKPMSGMKNLKPQAFPGRKEIKSQVQANSNNVQLQVRPGAKKVKVSNAVKPHSGKSIKPAGNGNEITATDYAYDSYYCDVYLYAQEGTFIFEMKDDPQFGVTYTLDDMIPEWVGMLDSEGYMDVRATAATLTLTKVNDLLNVVGTMTLNNVDYTITYQETPFVPSGNKIEVNATNYNAQYLSYYGEYGYTASNENYSNITILIYTDEEFGTFDDEVDIDYSYLQLPSSEYITFHSVATPIVVAQDEKGNKSLTGSLYSENGDEYVLNLTFTKPDAKEMNISVKNAKLNSKIAAGFWTIDGQTADKNNSFCLYFISKGLQGTFTEKNFDSYSTWVSDKSSGTNVYYENISGANIVSAIVADSLVVEGTLKLTSNAGEDAIVTLHVSTPFSQSWGDWDDFAPFDMNTGKFQFSAVVSSPMSQTKIPVKTRKDNTGLKQFMFEGWNKGILSEEGIDLLVNMNPDYSCTVPEQSTGIFQSYYNEYMMVSDLNTYTGGTGFPSNYNPETGVFNLALVYYISLGNFGYGYETMTMDHIITQRDTINVVSPKMSYNDSYIPSNGVVIYYTSDAEGFSLFRVTSGNATAVDGTFSWADGTINGINSYFTKTGSSTKNYFQDGEFTVKTEEDGTTTLKGWMIGENEKYYRLNFRTTGYYRDYGFSVRLVTEAE